VDIITYAGNGTANTVRYTNDDNPSLAVSVGDQAASKTYDRTWVCPKAIGGIHITEIKQKDGAPGIGADPPNFLGLNFVVYFTNGGVTGSTVSGSFDMTTERWTFGP